MFFFHGSGLLNPILKLGRRLVPEYEESSLREVAGLPLPRPKMPDFIVTVE